MELPIFVKFKGAELLVDCSPPMTYLQLRNRLYVETRVPIDKQKLLGLKLAKAGGTINDETALSEMRLRPGQKIMMLGTPEENMLKEPEEGEFEVVDDFDWSPDDPLHVRDDEVNLAKIRRRVEGLDIEIMNPPRKDRKCLVLDIDYTLFDHRSTVTHPLESMRPFLHDFLEAVYPYYDLIIWSATSMKWIKLKMNALSVFQNTNYKITFCIDHSAMIGVSTEWKGAMRVFDTKGLGVIWGKFPEFYTPSNTIHFDDIARNFIMNPQNGLKIRPFRRCHDMRTTDRELWKLRSYLIAISGLDDFSHLNHNKWERYMRKHHPELMHDW